MKTDSVLERAPESTASMAPTPEKILGITHAFWGSQILSAAARFRFFTHLSQGLRTAEEVARAAGTDPRATRMVLDSLVALGLLTKRDGAYALTPEAGAFLVEGRPGDLSPLVGGQVKLLWDDWGRLDEALKTGKPPHRVDSGDSAAEFFPKLIRSIMPLGLQAAEALAESLGAGTRLKGARVIDIGAGSAAWSIPFARRDPGARVTALDLGTVLAETRKIVAEHGVGDRFDLEEGDYRTADLGVDAYDLAILGNICHIETPARNRDLFTRIHRALKPGGRLLIGDMIPAEDRSSPPFPVLFAVEMLLHNEGGDTYTLSEYREWLGGAGFREVTTIDTKRSHSPVIVARK
jgi:3-hydroxy-5-methyl-1-naphthoate 3-O-methyltransferase